MHAALFRFFSALFGLALSAPLAAQLAEPGVVSLYTEKLEAVVVDNRAFGLTHFAGFNGLAEVRRNGVGLIEPRFAALDFEHIFNGDALYYPHTRFAPRQIPMELVRRSPIEVELRQSSNEIWPLQTVIVYWLGAGDAVDFEIRCTPTRDVWSKHGYVGVFFASYIDQPTDPAINFIGRSRPGMGDPTPRWINHVPPQHGIDACTRPAASSWEPTWDEGFPLDLVSHLTSYEYLHPFFYGVDKGQAIVVMFERNPPGGELRFAQSPTGGGPGNPAWDFAFFQRQYRIGVTFTIRGRLQVRPFTSREDIIRLYEAWSGEVIPRV